MQRELALPEHFLQVDHHAFADASDGEHLFRLADEIRDLLRLSFNGFGGIAVRANAERIRSIDLEQVGGFVENAGDGLVVHAM